MPAIKTKNYYRIDFAHAESTVAVFAIRQQLRVTKKCREQQTRTYR